MKSKQTIIITIAIFCLSLAIAFGITKYVKGKMDSSIGEKPVVEETDTTKYSLPDNDLDNLRQEDNTIAIHASNPKLNGGTYGFTASCENIPSGTNYHYELWNNKLVKKSTDGHFSGVPGTANGKYKLCVVSDKDGENLGNIEISGFKEISTDGVKMSKGQFQALLLNLRESTLLGGRNPQVAKSISFTFSDIQDGENRPFDVQSIRDKISFGVWKSAVVISVAYDEKNRINSAVVKPVY